MLLKNLIKNCPLPLNNVKVKGIATDSKQIKKGYLFFAIKGQKYNGIHYIKEAIKRGAKAVISGKRSSNRKIIFCKNKNIKATLVNACRKFYNDQPKNIIAVTGTNGKSSVVDYFRQLLCLNKKKVATIGTLGMYLNYKKTKSILTTPDLVSLHKFMRDIKRKKIDIVMLEASSHGLHQGRLDGLNLKAGVFTNLSQDHLDYHITKKNYLKAKLLLFRKYLKKGNFSILSNQVPEFNKIKQISIRRKLKIIQTNKIYKKLTNSKLKNFEAKFQLENLSKAIAAAKICGLKERNIIFALKKMTQIPGRLELVKKINNIKIFVDYAHTPDALEKVLNNLIEDNKRNITLVFGCGGERDIKKRKMMAKIANKYCRKVIVTDDNPRHENPKKIRNTLLKYIAKEKVYDIANRSKAINHAIKNSFPGECILIAGKGHETTQDYGKYILKISDKKIVKQFNRKKFSIDNDKKLNNFIFSNILNKKSNLFFDNISIDSRTIQKGNLFVAIKGKINNGNDFVNSALLKGANGAIRSSKLNNKKNTYYFKNTLKFLKLFGSLKRDFSNSTFIGVTGSSGKTTLKTMIGKVLSNFSSTYVSPKSYNNEFGVPLSLSNFKVKNKFCILEIGMSKKGEIHKLSKMVKPNIGIITNIGEAHMENFSSTKDIAKAKAEIIDNIVNNGHIILNRDDKFYHFHKKIADRKKLKVISFGLSKLSDIHIKKIIRNKVIVCHFKKIVNFKLANTNKINILNLLCCLAVLKILNLDCNKISETFNNTKFLEGRGKIFRVKRYKKIFNLIDESYNANPSSTKNAIENLSNLATKYKKYLIIGDMLELGKKSNDYHKDISNVINKSNVDKTFIYGQKVLITYKYLDKHKQGNILQNLSDLDQLLKNIIQNNDYLMIKGSNATGVSKFSKTIINGLKNVV